MVKDGSLVGFKKSRTMLLCSLPHTRTIVGSFKWEIFRDAKELGGGSHEMSMTSLVEKKLRTVPNVHPSERGLYKALTMHAIIHGLMFRNEVSNE